MKEKNAIKILIADDHQMLLDGLRSLLSTEENIHIVGEATHGSQVLDILGFHSVDIAIIDITMPGMDGYQTVLEIKQKHPQTRIIMLSLHKEEDVIRKFMEAGVSGYVIKDRGSEELVKAINTVASGEEYWDPEVVKISLQSIRKPIASIAEAPLSPREKEVLCLIGNGLTTKKIAEKLFIADSTVETHRKNILSKLGCDTSKQLIINFQNNKYKHLL